MNAFVCHCNFSLPSSMPKGEGSFFWDWGGYSRVLTGDKRKVKGDRKDDECREETNSRRDGQTGGIKLGANSG